MKINIKGFTFVGFAAAIFAVNAMAAGENIVTSKSYVDAQDALKQDKDSTQYYKVGKNGQWAAMTSAVTAADGGYITIGSGTDGEAVVGIAAADVKSTLGTGLDSESPDLITEGVVAEALEQNGGQVNSGVIYVTQNGVAVDDFGVNDADSSTIAILAPDWDSASGQQAILNKPTITNDKAEISNATDQDTKQLPTTYAVKQYLADTSVVGNGQVSITVNSTTGTFNVNDSGNTTFSVTGLEEITNKAEAISTGTGGNYNDSTQYASTKAVYDYVQAQTGGTVIPQKSTTCDTYPCALVESSAGAHWYTMAQSGHDGGVLGDYCESGDNCGVSGWSCVTHACTRGE